MATEAKTLVVDASVATKWHLVDEEHAAAAELLLRHFAAGRTQLIAPGHIRYEVPSAITVATRGPKARLTQAQGEDAIADFLALGLQTVEDDDLLRAAYRLAHEHRVAFYDALYLALAARLEIPVVTADRRLFDQVREVPHVVWIDAIISLLGP